MSSYVRLLTRAGRRAYATSPEVFLCRLRRGTGPAVNYGDILLCGTGARGAARARTGRSLVRGASWRRVGTCLRAHAHVRLHDETADSNCR